MRREENDCVCCPPGVPCMGDCCPYRHAIHIYCDCCGEEIAENEDYGDGKHEDYCYDCACAMGIIDEEDPWH